MWRSMSTLRNYILPGYSVALSLSSPATQPLLTTGVLASIDLAKMVSQRHSTSRAALQAESCFFLQIQMLGCASSIDHRLAETTCIIIPKNPEIFASSKLQ